MELLSALFSPSSKKKSPPREKFLYGRKIEISSSNIKNFLHFLKRKLYLYLRKRKPPKKFLIFPSMKDCLIFQKTDTPKKQFIFQEKELSYISGNANPKKSLIFQEVTFRARKFFLFQEQLPKPQKLKFMIHFRRKL